jgi:hypothetical protein
MIMPHELEVLRCAGQPGCLLPWDLTASYHQENNMHCADCEGKEVYMLQQQTAMVTDHAC